MQKYLDFTKSHCNVAFSSSHTQNYLDFTKSLFGRSAVILLVLAMDRQTKTEQKKVLPYKSHLLHQLLVDLYETSAVVKVSNRVTIRYKAIFRIAPRS